MRKRFEAQYELGATPIGEVQFPEKSRDEMPAVLRALQYVYTTPELNEQIFDLLEKRILKGKKKTGRNGMSLWEILVFGIVRLARDMNYDFLEYSANYDMLVRSILGVEVYGASKPKRYNIQTLKDNISLIDADLLKELNAIIVAGGHEIIGCKKKDLSVKVDSYVLESTVHFPTDINLLWDAARKCFDIIERLGGKNSFIKGWRKQHKWRRQIKNAYIAAVRCSAASGGKNKQDRLKETVCEYLRRAKKFQDKIEFTRQAILQQIALSDAQGLFAEFHYFEEMLIKHIELLERRVIRGEKIPHDEKVFSLFETYTPWINKGKSGNRVELGLPVVIATDQHGFVLDHCVMSDKQTDVTIAQKVGRSLRKWENIKSISSDKGFWSQKNYDELCLLFEQVILPKRGKHTKEQAAREQTKQFKSLRKSHAAVESDINALEHHGLNRCPDKGLKHFETYTALGILALNIHRLGNLLLAGDKKSRECQKRLLAV